MTDLHLVSSPLPTLPLSEVFGPTFQGEGPHLGTRCGFVRLGLCNLSCTWCDTPYTWDHRRYDVAAECPDTSVPAIAEAVLQMDVTTVVLSGGEPLLHAKRDPGCPLGQLLDATRHRVAWHVETNGTIPPPAWLVARVAHFTVSPKMGTGAHDPVHKRLRPAVLAQYAALADQGQAAIKIVCSTPNDVRVAAVTCAQYGLSPDTVWIMPEGTGADRIMEVQRTLAPHVRDHGFHLTTRLHTLLYGNERGV